MTKAQFICFLPKLPFTKFYKSGEKGNRCDKHYPRFIIIPHTSYLYLTLFRFVTPLLAKLKKSNGEEIGEGGVNRANNIIMIIIIIMITIILSETGEEDVNRATGTLDTNTFEVNLHDIHCNIERLFFHFCYCGF